MGNKVLTREFIAGAFHYGLDEKRLRSVYNYARKFGKEFVVARVKQPESLRSAGVSGEIDDDEMFKEHLRLHQEFIQWIKDIDEEAEIHPETLKYSSMLLGQYLIVASPECVERIVNDDHDLGIWSIINVKDGKEVEIRSKNAPSLG
jgi:hypothetical protein